MTRKYVFDADSYQLRTGKEPSMHTAQVIANELASLLLLFLFRRNLWRNSESSQSDDTTKSGIKITKKRTQELKTTETKFTNEN